MVRAEKRFQLALKEVLACSGMGKMANPVKIKGMRRHDLYEKFAEKGYKVGAEIGVFRGRNAYDICRTVPNVKLYGIDNWERKDSYETMRNVMKNYIRRGQFIIVKSNSIDAAFDFADESLDFVYIDADHSFDAVVQDLIKWSGKVRKGGIVSGHDYFKRYRRHVMNAVNAYVYAHNIKKWYVTDEPAHKGKRANSFFWEKC